MTEAEVLITGIGVVSPLGVGAEVSFKAALGGHSAIVGITDPVAAEWPVRVWAPVPDQNLQRVTDQERRSVDRSGLFALEATREAWEQAGRPAVDPERLAVVFSSGMGGLNTLDAGYHRYLLKGARPRATVIPRAMPNAAAALIALELGAQAGTYGLVSACASGSDAIAQGYRLIMSGEADVVVTGGSDALLSPVVVLGFAALRALSSCPDPARASRPFDRSRDGFVIGEGGAVLILESRRHASARVASVLGALRGIAVSSDAYHIVAPDPSGVQAARCMARCLAVADVRPDELGAVSAHATGTQAGDAAEATALGKIFGAQVAEVPVTAVKSMTGHLVGGAGPLASALAVMSLREGVLTPTPTFEEADQGVRLNIVSDRHRQPLEPLQKPVLVNAFGFGGHNVSLCFANP